MIYKYNEFLLEYKARYSKSDKIEDFADLYIDKIAKKLNVKLIKKLGMGSYGIAYLVDKDKVIKVTSDPKEARNARKLMGEDLEHFVNYYDVFEITLDDVEFSSGSQFKELYFILMDYVRPLSKKEKVYWSSLSAYYFDIDLSDDDFIENVYHEFFYIAGVEDEERAEDAIEYFKPFMKQRHEMWEEGTDYGIGFIDAHSDNLGFRRDGTLVYFDVGGPDDVTIYGEGGEEKDIEKKDFENDFKKMKKMIIDKYEPDVPIPINDLLKDISELLNVNRVKAYKYLRDEIHAQYVKSSREAHTYPSPIVFRAFGYNPLNKKDEWTLSFDQISPIWKKAGYDIYVVFKEDYEKRTIEKRYGMRKLKPRSNF